MVDTRDSRADTGRRTITSMEETDDHALVAMAVALGAKAVGGPLSLAEKSLVGLAGHIRITPSVVDEARAAIVAGGDPLGVEFYGLRSPVIRRQQGAVYTPPSLVGPMVRWTLDQDPARVVDAGSGSGRYSAAVARLAPSVEVLAIDLDPLATLMTRASLAALGHERSLVLNIDYTKVRLPKIDGRTAYLGNPPYLRHHDLSPRTKAWAQAAAKIMGRTISGLAGLHALFYLATAQYGREGDVGCFVTSGEWLDVNYGRVVRELLLENLGGEAIYVIEPESLPFGDTATTAAIACFRVGGQPPKLRLRGVPSVADLPRLEGGQSITRERLAVAPRWSHFIRASKPVPAGYVELGELCRVHRGAVTGSNATWVRRADDVDLPDSVLFPSVTRARELFAAGDRLASLDGLKVVVDLPADLDELDPEARKRAVAFLRDAKRAGVKKGYIAANRKAWWRVGLRDPAPILATYMARRPPAFVRNEADARHINIAHGLYPRVGVDLSPTALDRLAQHLRTTVGVGSGRTYSGGLTKFEPKEMERLPVPDVTLVGA